MSMPPTKPTLPVSDLSAAAMPTRKEPSCSLNTTDCTLSSLDHASMMVNLVSGNSAAIVSSGVAWEKPTATTMVAPAPRHAAKRLIPLAFVGDLEFQVLDAGLVLEPFGAVIGGLVEGFVELAAHIEDDGRLEILGNGGPGGHEHGTRGQNGGGESAEKWLSHPCLPRSACCRSA